MFREYVYRVLGWCPRLNLDSVGEKTVSDDPSVGEETIGDDPDIPKTFSFTCPKCNSTKVKVLSSDTRSFIGYDLICLDCDYRFSEGLIDGRYNYRKIWHDTVHDYRNYKVAAHTYNKDATKKGILDKIFNINRSLVFQVIPISVMVVFLGISIITYLLNDIAKTYTLLSGAAISAAVFIGYRLLTLKKS